MDAIQRHIKIRRLANQFDPAWDIYFARHRTTKRSVSCPVHSIALKQWLEPDVG